MEKGADGRKRRRCGEDLWRWAPRGTTESSLLCRVHGGGTLSPLCTPISPSHSPRGRAGAEPASDSHSI